MKNISQTAVVIPAHNEAETIRKLVRLIQKTEKNIIVIDDGSTDGIAEVLRREKVVILTHIVNLGKGAALATGVEYAQKAGFSKVILMDADGQHSSADLPAFEEALGKADLILGVRKLSLRDTGFRYLGNRINSLVIKWLFGEKVADPLCGYRAFNLRIYPKLKWESSGYGVETEMVIRAIQNKIKFKEIPVSSIYIDKYKGVSVIDAYKIFFDMLKWRASI